MQVCAFLISCMWVLLPDTPIQLQPQALEDPQRLLQRSTRKIKKLQIMSDLNLDSMRAMKSTKRQASKWRCLEIFSSLHSRASLLHRFRQMSGCRAQID